MVFSHLSASKKGLPGLTCRDWGISDPKDRSIWWVARILAEEGAEGEVINIFSGQKTSDTEGEGLKGISLKVGAGL